MQPHRYLTEKETLALALLSEEKGYHVIARECDIPDRKLNAFLQALRSKTGIANTRNADEIKEYLTAYAQAVNGTGPSIIELEALRRIMGVDYPVHSLEALPTRMDLGNKTAAEVYASALRAAGIFAKGQSTQRLQARIYLASLARVREGKMPLSDPHRKVLKLLLQGYNREGIALELEWNIGYVKSLVSEIAQRLGVVSRGRGAQDKLIRFAAARLEEEERAAKAPEIDPLDDY